VNGIHDMGGMHGFGRIEREPNEPVFHEPWERRVFGLTVACGSQRNMDEFRHAVERMAPVDYLGSSYYERWLDSTLRLLVEKGVITREALERRMAQLASGPDPAPPHSDPELLARMVRRRKARTPFRQPGPPPRYALGDHIVTRHDAPVGHTRLPRYARGKLGVIVRVHGSFIFPDTNAHGQGAQPHPLYSVRFEAAELWGATAEPCAPVHLDLWERYLQSTAPTRSTSRGAPTAKSTDDVTKT
jgi:nitrile hydratase subunit beta